MENEFMKRGYLLPEGCKDLIDVLHLRAQTRPNWPPDPRVKSTFLPLIVGELAISLPTTVAQVAELLKQNPTRIIADFMELGVFASLYQTVDFDSITRVARKYGYLVRRAP